MLTLTKEDLLLNVPSGSITDEQAEVIAESLNDGASLIVTGVTGSGKTTLLAGVVKAVKNASFEVVPNLNNFESPREIEHFIEEKLVGSSDFKIVPEILDTTGLSNVVQLIESGKRVFFTAHSDILDFNDFDLPLRSRAVILQYYKALSNHPILEVKMARDERGNRYVTDVKKSVVLMSPEELGMREITDIKNIAVVLSESKEGKLRLVEVKELD